jgi:hypothetical protein
MEDPRSGDTTIERYASMPAAIARAAWLIHAGYRVGIWSPASFEPYPIGPIVANDDAREAVPELMSI